MGILGYMGYMGARNCYLLASIWTGCSQEGFSSFFYGALWTSWGVTVSFSHASEIRRVWEGLFGLWDYGLWGRLSPCARVWNRSRVRGVQSFWGSWAVWHTLWAIWGRIVSSLCASETGCMRGGFNFSFHSPPSIDAAEILLCLWRGELGLLIGRRTGNIFGCWRCSWNIVAPFFCVLICFKFSFSFKVISLDTFILQGCFSPKGGRGCALEWTLFKWGLPLLWVSMLRLKDKGETLILPGSNPNPNPIFPIGYAVLKFFFFLLLLCLPHFCTSI